MRTAAPASASEAMEMVRAGLGYLAAANATAMAAETQALCLRMLEQAHSMGTAARTSVLAAFTAGQGYSAARGLQPAGVADGRTRITKGAAVAHTAWVRAGAGASGGRGGTGFGGDVGVVRADDLLWTDKLPEDCREDADEILLTAARTGMGLPDLAGLAGKMTTRSRPANPDSDEDTAFEDRSVRLETTFGGAGVLHGDLTPECAAVSLVIPVTGRGSCGPGAPGRGTVGRQLAAGEVAKVRREVARHGEFAAISEQIAEVNEKICEARPAAGTDAPSVPEGEKGGSSTRSRGRRPPR